MEFKRRYTQLNKAQQQAVDTIDGPVMVIAGPGTGKTELLSVRVANILQKTDTPPEAILCLTFTESGQAAMRERLVGIIGKDAYKVPIHTFHSFGSDIIASNREFFYQSALFEPADELKQYEVMRDIFETLDHKSPIAGTMNGEFTYLADAQKVISELKRGSALTSDELLAVIQQGEGSLDEAERLLIPILEARVDKTTLTQLSEALINLRDKSQQAESLYGVTPLIHIISDSLAEALETAATDNSTKPITLWKGQWTERNESKELVFKNRKRLAKLKALSYVYYEYLNQMEKRGLFDYDDMIMQVVHAVEVHDDLRFNLQERYLYIMVDEFQDTNLAQLRMLHNLTDSPVNEGRPNILVVGDDDQAVYGFQGADVSNILNFTDTYPSRALIVLTENYRSQEAILNTSRAVISQGTDRLENRLPELSKQLTAMRNDNKDKTDVAILQAPSIEAERQHIVESIKQQLEKGAEASSIAVLARRHADIQSLLPYFSQANISVRYEREENVLDSPPIEALSELASVIVALGEGRHDEVQAALPKLLAHPAWKISAHDLWKLSLDAYTSRQNWMEVMATTPAFTNIHAWLVECAKEAKTANLEPMIDRLIGKVAVAKATDSSSEQSQNSPFFDYFFSDSSLQNSPDEYLSYLEALRSIRTKLREYKPGEVLNLKSLLDFIALHRRLSLGITSRRYSLSNEAPAVQLLTAHKSKGLEFDTVYVFNSVDSVWGQGARSHSRNISYPENLPLAPAGNSADERLRLFYVAMTRARNQLYISFSETNETNKATLRADFLVDSEAPVHTIEKSQPTTDSLIKTAEQAWYQSLVLVQTDLKELLAPQLEKFKLSATSLNNFLDVSRGGPQLFLLNNLLRFPQAKSASASYGTAIHWTVQQAHTHLSATGETKPLEDSLHDFEQALSRERLNTKDYAYYLQQGSEHLPIFFNSGVLPMNPTQKAEVNFGHQDVRIDAARLTGSLDVLSVDSKERTVVVTDYKTGHPAASWGKGTDHTKHKLHKYRQQLLFYKLLVENSQAYTRHTVTTGQLAFIEPTKSGDSVVLSLEPSREEVERTRQLVNAVWQHIMNFNFPDTSQYSPDLNGTLAFEQDLLDGVI